MSRGCAPGTPAARSSCCRNKFGPCPLGVKCQSLWRLATRQPDSKRDLVRPMAWRSATTVHAVFELMRRTKPTFRCTRCAAYSTSRQAATMRARISYQGQQVNVGWGNPQARRSRCAWRSCTWPPSVRLHLRRRGNRPKARLLGIQKLTEVFAAAALGIDP